jgi:hypothetical protein
MATITQMLAVLDDAIDQAETRKRLRSRFLHRRVIVVHFTKARVLGQVGVPDGVDEMERPVYGFTLTQCRRMRASILDAAREDYQATEPP